MPSFCERYVASMVLSGAGDSLGYKGGNWEFCLEGATIHKELAMSGGLANIYTEPSSWPVSDDTVMHLATAEALVDKSENKDDRIELYHELARNYQNCMYDMDGRAPGDTSSYWSSVLKPGKANGYKIPFNESGGGCGSAMRAMCIGLRYPRPEDLNDLIAVSIEAGRMTHHHPTGFLGSLASALFVSYSVQGKPLKSWGAGLMSVLPEARQYIEDEGSHATENGQAWEYFRSKWKAYLEERQITDGESEPKFPCLYGILELDAFCRKYSFRGWGGASGHDAPMIAYDALLGGGDSWEEVCKRGMFHGGDSDSTGVISGACFGAMYGFQSVPDKNYQSLEYRDRLSSLGVKLFQMSHPGADCTIENDIMNKPPPVSDPGSDTPPSECAPPVPQRP